MGNYNDSFLTSWGEEVPMPPEAHLTGGEPQEDPAGMTSWSRADRDGVEDERATEDARQAVRDDPHLRNALGQFASPEQVLREAAREERREREQARQSGRGAKAAGAAAGVLGAFAGKAAGGAAHGVGKGVGAATGGRGSTGGFKDAERRGLFRKPKKRVTRKKRTFVFGPFVFSRTTEREKGY